MASKIIFNCENCQTRDFIEGYEAMVQHLQEVHGIDAKTAKCTRRMVMHLDGSEYSVTNFQWTVQGEPPVQLTSTTRVERDPNDPMRMGR